VSTHFPDDDPLAARLRTALTSEADMVNPADDGLSSIRDGIAAHRGRPWWQHPATPAAAAAVLLAAMAGGFFLLAGGGDDKNNAVVGTTTSSTPAPTASSSRSVDPEPSDPPMTGTPRPAGDTAKVYVYYVHDDGKGFRLYREVHAEETAGNTPNSGLLSLFDSPAKDPEYRSLWPSGTTCDFQVAGSIATVNLSAWPALGSGAETAAVQELVYTVTANYPAVKGVRLLVNGQTPASGHLDLSKPIARAPMVDVQGLIWLLSPAQGATVSSPVTISGYGTAFEGTISWEVRKDGKKVASGSTQGGSNGDFGSFRFPVTLPPGSYEVRAFESSAEDGSAQHVDTKDFTVR
jgi:immunoglobulin-like protein involved in spore germination/sporulation and spore germination protein